MMKSQIAKLADNFKKSSLTFIEVETRTGLNFANLAFNATDQARRHRDIVNARKAYESALSFMGKHDGPSTPDQVARVLDGFHSLRSQLIELGESLPPLNL